MKNIKNLATALMLIATTSAFAQAPSSSPTKDITYTMKQASGTNATTVAWVPGKDFYVTVIAGNASFPLEGFRADGRNIFANEAGFDYRGLWYNPKTKKMEGNGAGEAGWVTFGFDANNGTQAHSVIAAGQNQPDFQSVGVFDTGKKSIAFLSEDLSQIKFYSRKKPSKTKSVVLSWGSVNTSNINPYSLGYTGVSGYEFVCLDYVNRTLVFFNRSGSQTASVKLPADAPMNSTFAFGFANKHAFCYNKDTRTWSGYKVF